MKNNTFFPISGLLSALILLSFFSCSEKKFNRELNTPEMTITILGNKPNALDPYTVDLIVTNKANKKTANLNMEVFASELSESNPTFTTSANGKHILIFTQTDHTVRELTLSIQDNEVVIEEVL